MVKQLSIQQLTASAESALGWPYVSPGSNDSHGIDCSGLFVKMYRDQGAQIYHGSNTIFHEYCKLTDKLEGIGQLEPGMAVFKVKPWTSDDSDNRWYGQEPGNVSHIGYVASVNPLRIIHASSAAGCVTTDDSIGKWKYWGLFKNVSYDFIPGEQPATVSTPASMPAESPPVQAVPPTLRKGAKGENVRRMQETLVAAGFVLPKYGVDGSFGWETLAALKAYQKSRGLKVDGICGPKTWAAIGGEKV